MAKGEKTMAYMTDKEYIEALRDDAARLRREADICLAPDCGCPTSLLGIRRCTREGVNAAAADSLEQRALQHERQCA